MRRPSASLSCRHLGAHERLDRGELGRRRAPPARGARTGRRGARAAAGRIAGRRLDRVGELGRVGGGQAHHRHRRVAGGGLAPRRRRPRCAGRRACPCASCTRRMTSAGRRRRRAGRRRTRSRARRAPRRAPTTVPSARNRAIISATAAPSRPSTSNSSRSRLDDTWMSMRRADVVGTTPRISIVAGGEEPGEDVVAVATPRPGGRRAGPCAWRPTRRGCCRSCRWARRS